MLSYNSPDLAGQFNRDYFIVIDAEMWQTITVQFTSAPTGTISIKGTNDPGAIDSVSAGNAIAATNFTTIQATTLSNGTAVTAVVAADLYKITVNCRFIRIGATAPASASTTGKVIWFGNTPR